MSATNHPSHLTISTAFLLGLSRRLTIGSAVGFTEGFVASVMLFAPANYWFFIASLTLAFGAWLGFWCFRDTTIGADVGDLYFYNFLIYSIGLIAYLNNQNVGGLWYVAAMLALLRLIRVYIWQSSSTQQHGWGQFGPLTWYHARHGLQPAQQKNWQKLAPEIIGALLVAILGAMLLRQLPDIGRVAAIWIVPLVFEFMYGPRQLRSLSEFGQNAMASNQREADLAAKLTECQQNLVLLQQSKNLPDDEDSAKIVALFKALPPKRRDGLLQFAAKMVENFGNDKPENGGN